MAEMSLSEYVNHGRPGSKKRSTGPRSAFIVVGAVLIAGLGFLGGMQYQKGKTPATTAQTTSGTQQTGTGGAGGYGGGSFRRGDRAFGTVSSVSSSSIAIQTRSGSTATYTITSNTSVTNDGQTASVSDIQSGDTVALTLDSSNTQDVSSIMLNPSFGGFGGNSGGAPSSTGASASGV
ncbi:MAG TPA: hypothetical protein VMB52_05485 [Verrucomicrobiae bacterium]|nr:hypothetical protein [Verrucomicrobiae bacterium]